MTHRFIRFFSIITILCMQFPVGNVQIIPSLYTLSGQVTDGEGNGIVDVIITATIIPWNNFMPLIYSNNISNVKTVKPNQFFSEGAKLETYTTTTDENGFYSFTDLIRGQYKISASKDSITFDPSLQIAALPAITNFDFKVQIIEPEISPSVDVIDPTTNQYLSSVSADGADFTFSPSTSELQSLNVGDIIIGDTTTVTPNGYLRKVSNITHQGNEILISTVSAKLEDAVMNGSAYLNKDLTPADATETSFLSGVKEFRRQDFNNNTFSFVLKDVSLSENGVVANGTIEFEMKPEFYINIQGKKLQSLVLCNHSTIRDTIEISGTSNRDDIGNEKIISKKTFSPWKVWIGDVPVLLVPELEVIVGVDGSVNVGMTTSISQELTLDAGIKYNAINGWDRIGNLYPKIIPITKPKLDPKMEASFQGYFGLQLNIFLYGVAGPYVKLTPYAELSIEPLDDPWWTLSGGVSAPAGFRVSETVKKIGEKIGLDLEEHEVVALDYKQILRQGHYPNVPSGPSPAHGADNQNRTISLSWNGGDPDGDEVTYKVSLGSDSSTLDINQKTNILSFTNLLDSRNLSTPSFTPSSLKPSTTYFWKVTTTDEDGASKTGPVWSFRTAENLPPNISPFSPEDGLRNDHKYFSVAQNYLEWFGNDPEGDEITYDVYFEANNPDPSLVSKDQPSNKFILPELDVEATYYWKITARDKYNASDTSKVLSFSTFNTIPECRGQLNYNSYGQNIIDLEWPKPLIQGSDIYDCDNLTFDLFFERGNPAPNVFVQNLTGMDYSFKDPLPVGTYYWKIVAKDEHGASCSYPVSHFSLVPIVNP